MTNQNDDYDLGQEIERSWLIRGEYDKVFEGRAIALLLFGGTVLVSLVLGLLIHGLGIEW